jgi:hypothetical protein
MTNVPMDLLKLQAKKQPKPGDLNANLQTQGSLAKMRYEIGAGVPTQEDDAANVFSAMRGQLGNGPQRGWRAALAGLMDGLALGSKSKGNEKRRDMAAKMMETFSSLEGIANEAGRRNEIYAKKAALQEQITPELEALTKNIHNLPYDDVVKVGSNIVDRINQSSGTNYKISMIDQQNGKVLLTEENKPDQKVDLFAMFPKIREEQNVEYLTKKAMQIQAEQDRRAEAQLGINQQNADAIQNRNQFSQDPDKQHDVMLGKEQAKALAKSQEKLSEQNLALEDVTYKIQDLKELLKTSEVITGSTLEAGFERLIGKQLGTKAYADTELYDAISKGLLSFVKGNLAFGNMNQKEFEFLTAQTPNSQKTKAALERMLNRFETTLDRQIKRNEREIHKIPSYGTRNEIKYEEQQAQMPVQPQQLPPEQIQAPQPSSPQSQAEMVRMTAPDGTAVLIPAANVDLAISQGARLVE